MESEDFSAGGICFASGAVGSVVAATATYLGGSESLAIDGAPGSVILKAGRLNLQWQDGREEELRKTSGTAGGADPMAFLPIGIGI